MSRPLIRILGLWKDYDWRSNRSVQDEPISKEGSFKPPTQVIEYLKSGIRLVTTRTVLDCIITGKYIGSPSVFTDGTYLWSQAYLFYVENGMLEIDPNFFEFIKQRNFQCPTKEQIGLDHLLEIHDEFIKRQVPSS